MIEELRTRADELVVDPEDMDLVKRPWKLRNGRLWSKGNYLHHIIAKRMKLPGKNVSHVDQNPYNNKRSNLQPTTKRDQPTHKIEVYKYGKLAGFAIVDMQDADLDKFKWFKSKNTAKRGETRKFRGRPEQHVIYLHYEVARRMGVDCELVKQIKHKNKVGLDNRRSNLKFIW